MKDCMHEFYYADNDNETCINTTDTFYSFTKLFSGKLSSDCGLHYMYI